MKKKIVNVVLFLAVLAAALGMTFYVGNNATFTIFFFIADLLRVFLPVFMISYHIFANKLFSPLYPPFTKNS